MPQFDLRHIQAAAYQYDSQTKTVSHGEKTKVGDAMTAGVEVRRAEGRLYAEGRLAEFMALITGGTISYGVKYVLDDAKKLLYGFTENTVSVNEKPISGLRLSTKSVAKYVSTSFYTPDIIDGVTKYTCMYIAKALFSPPSYSFQTKGQNLTFNTPTTTGEFLADDSSDEVLLDTAVCDTIADAEAWCDAVLS